MFPQTQGFDSHAAKHVGRVGALAVALGVGAAILGFPGVAAWLSVLDSPAAPAQSTEMRYQNFRFA
jgi:hypothetical protein